MRDKKRFRLDEDLKCFRLISDCTVICERYPIKDGIVLFTEHVPLQFRFVCIIHCPWMTCAWLSESASD